MNHDIINNIHRNLTESIKKKGYNLVSFPPTYLNCTYQAFNWRLKNGKFHIIDLITCTQLLNISLQDLLTPRATKSRKKYTHKNKPQQQSFDKLKSLF